MKLIHFPFIMLCFLVASLWARDPFNMDAKQEAVTAPESKRLPENKKLSQECTQQSEWELIHSSTQSLVLKHHQTGDLRIVNLQKNDEKLEKK